MRVNAGLYVDNSNGSALVPPNSGWQLNYPGSAGVYAMNLISAEQYRNYYVELEVIDAFTFTIHYKFLMVTDINGFIGGVPPIDNNNPFLPGGMYSNAQGIEMFVTDGFSNVYQYVPVQANPFCTGSVEFGTDGTDGGFTPGQALNITIDVNEVAVSNNFYFGFFETTAISNNVGFVEDSGLSYGQIANGVTTVPNIPNDCITGGTGFVGRDDIFQGTVQIDKVCLNEGSCYRAYVVYQAGGAWKSCISEEICATAAAVPPVIGDFDCQITDAFGTSYDECCLSNMPTCGSIEVCVNPDVASFDALLSAAGLGVFGDYYRGVRAYVSNTFPTPENPGTALSVAVNVYEACINYTPVADATEVKYFTFRYMLDYENHTDNLDVVVQVGFNGSIQVPDYTATFADGTVMTNKFCAEDIGPLTITYPAETGANCTLLQSINGGEATPANVISHVPGTIVVDPDNIGIGEQVCFIICCADEDVSTPCNCSEECEQITFDIIQDTCGFVSGNSNGTVGLFFGLQGIPSNEVTNVNIQTSTGHTFDSSSGTISDTFVVNYDDPVRIGYDITIELENGCVFEPPIIWLQSAGSDAGPECIADYRTTVAATDCPCNTEEDPCESNFAAIIPSCDTDTGEINFTTFESFASPVFSDIIECSTDGLVFGPCSLPAPGPELHVRRTVEFTDSCPNLVVEQLITCEATQICQNQSTLELNITAGVLTLTLTGNYNSPGATEKIFVSLDGGATFGVYTTPIVLSGGESIVAYAVTAFSDGCPNLISNTVTGTYAFDCDYSGYSVSCAFDEVTGFFTASFVGDESVLAVNNKLYSSDGSNPETVYPGPVVGTVFIIKWEIALPGCETICLVSACADCDSIQGSCFSAGNGDDSAGC
ncbi:MAG: hypothetical protein ACWA44_02415 [Thiotrichales bacterium]